MRARFDDIVAAFQEVQSDLVLQASDLSLGALTGMIEGGSIDISPEYQRRERWPHEAQSALIESFLLNIPVPPIYLSEDEYGTYSVIDGKQRLTAIHAFMTGELTLRGLDRFTELEGLRIDSLPSPLVNALRVRPYVRAVTLLRQTAPHLKYEVFLRLNTAGTPLLPQEIRNVAFRGPLNDAIYKLAEAPFLHQQLKIKGKSSPNYRNMLDAEFVLRFLMLSDHWENFSGDFRRSLDAYMAEHHDSGVEKIEELNTRFYRALARVEALWGTTAFKRPERFTWRDQALAGAYDAEMLAAHLLSETDYQRLSGHPESVVALTRRLFNDHTFDTAVRVGTNTPSRVQFRVRTMLDALRNQARERA